MFACHAVDETHTMTPPTAARGGKLEETAMRFQSFTRFVAAAFLFAASVVAASAQVVTASGKVTLKRADGTTVLVKNAVVKFYRTDIKQEFSAKTDKGGRYVNAGIPLVGTFHIAVSAPGARPDFIPNVKISTRPVNEFALEPGGVRR